MAALPQLQELDAKVADLLAMPTFLSYCRVLSLVDEITELASSPSSSSSDPATTTALLENCESYRALCHRSIKRLAEHASQHEREMYRRAALKTSKDSSSSQSEETQRKHHGIVFDVHRGVHIAAAVEALNLEELLKEQDERSAAAVAAASKKVRFADSPKKGET